MINSIKIKNFQSHKNTTLELDKGVNVITGSSDSGKTAIIRALRWLVWNRPGGDEFRSSWGGDTSVTINTDDITISRSKGKQGNLYEIDDSPFVGFGTEVPNEVQKVLSISEINLQQQLDSPFLLSETPGNVAQYFNKIAKLDTIDSTTQNINKSIRKLNSDIQYQQGQLQKYKDELKEYPDLDEIEKILRRIERKETRFEDLQFDKKQINQTINKIEEIDEVLKEENQIIQLESSVTIIQSKIEKRDDLEERLSVLINLIDSIEKVELEEVEIRKISKLGQKVDTLIQKLTDRRNLDKEIQRLSRLVGMLPTLTKSIVKTQENALQLEQQFKIEMGNVCILCGSKLK